MARARSRAVAAGALLLGALLVTAAPAPARAAEAKHGLSAFGDLAYQPDFQHFDYVNPDAPKGGTFSLIGWGGVTTFDSLNNYILKGDAAQGLELLFDTLMTRAADEPDAVYGLVASSAEVADDGMSVTFKLRPEAKFSDGSPLTADDVVFSFEALKTKGHPIFAQTLARRGEGRGARSAHRALQLQRLAYPRSAAHRGGPADLLQGLLRDATTSPRRRSSRRSARAPIRSATSSRAAPSPIVAIRTIGPRTCRSIAGAGTSTRSASNISATAPPAWRPSRPGPTISARSSPRRSGPPNTISRRSAPAR